MRDRYSDLAELSAFFKTCEGRKVSTRRALISISCPVCGLRPTRDFFSRTTKFPKPESLIFSPFSSVSLMVSNTISTISALSFLENPTSLHTLSITSALVMSKTIVEGTRASQSNGLRGAGAVARLPSSTHILRPDLGSERRLQALLDDPAERVSFPVSQCSIRLTQRQAKR